MVSFAVQRKKEWINIVRSYYAVNFVDCKDSASHYFQYFTGICSGEMTRRATMIKLQERIKLESYSLLKFN